MHHSGIGFGGGASFLFSMVPIFIGIVFVIVIGGILFSAFRYFKNASSPRESVYAMVVAKRMDIRNYTNHHQHANGTMHPTNSSRTFYYITLEFENGERREYLDVKHLYGLVVEGDTGYAAIQGDWIVAFQRNTV